MNAHKILNLVVCLTLATLAFGGSVVAQGNVNAGNELGLAWRERQKTYSMVGQSGRSGLLNSTSIGNPLAGPISLDPQPDTESGEVALEYRPGKTESPVIVPSVARIMGETQFSPAMAKAYVDSLNAELTAAGATIAAIEPMLAQHANISTSIGLSMANAQVNADAALDAQLGHNGQNGENIRNIFRGCLAKRLQDHDNYLQAVEYCRGGTAKPIDTDKFNDFAGNTQRMKPSDSPDHSLQYGGSDARDSELLLSDLIFSQNVVTVDRAYSKSTEHLHKGFRALFGDAIFDYNQSGRYGNFGLTGKSTVVSPVKGFVEPLLLPYSTSLTLPNSSKLRLRDYYVSLHGVSMLMRGLPLYDRYRGEYTYATLVGLTRGYCEYYRNHVGDNGLDKTDHNDDEDRFWRLISSGKNWSGGSFGWLNKWLPKDASGNPGENALGVLSVGDFAFSHELGQWMVSAFFRERKIDPAAFGWWGTNPCAELDPYNDSMRYMEIKRRLRAKEATGAEVPVPTFLRRYVEYADIISRMQTLMILSDTWNDVLKTLGDTQYMDDASKVIDLAAGSLDVESIGTDKVELQKSLQYLLDRLRQDYSNSVGTGSGMSLPERKAGGGNALGN